MGEESSYGVVAAVSGLIRGFGGPSIAVGLLCLLSICV
jgi:hypothetical protein